MKKIYKYKLEITDTQTICIPKGSRILCLQSQLGYPCIWAIVDTLEDDYEYIVIRTIGTGHAVPEDIGEYLGTFQQIGGSFIGHCFMKTVQLF